MRGIPASDPRSRNRGFTASVSSVMEQALRLPPQAIEAEQSVLGALLLWPDAYDRIEFLRPEHFYQQRHRLIFETLRELIEHGKAADYLTVAESLDRASKLAEVGGNQYLGELACNTMSAANIRRHAEMVRDAYLRRQVQARCMEFYDRAQQAGAVPVELAQEAEAAFLEILQPAGRTDEVSLGQAVAEAVDARDTPMRSMPTGLATLDQMLKAGGLRAGQLMIVAGRSSMGKSALMQQIAEHVGRHNSVAYFTLEMSRQELGERALAYHERQVGLSEAYAHLASLKVHIDETPAATLVHVRLRARRIKRKLGLGLIVVDYLQLMPGKGENRTQEIGSLTRGLKAIAKELQVPVVVGAQINRGVEGRTDRRPLLSDLRESGDIENDSDVVLMLYREDYYNPETEARGLAEIIIRKQRNGPVGTVFMRFEPETTRFSPWQGELPRASAPRRGGTVEAVDFKSRAAGSD